MSRWLIGIYLVIIATGLVVFLMLNPQCNHEPQTVNACADELSAVTECEAYANHLEGGIEELQHELLLLKVEQCESSFRHEGVYGEAGEYGRYQYKEATFEYFKRLSGMTSLQWKSSADQETLTRWAFANGMENHWTCYGKVVDQNQVLIIGGGE